MKSIGIFSMGGDNWTFGNVYISDLVNTILKYSDEKVRICYLIPKSKEDSIPDICGAESVVFNDYPFDFSGAFQLAVSGIRAVTMRSAELRSIVRGNALDAIIGHALNRRKVGTAVVSWLPDFQHKYYPGMFTQDECGKRDALFASSAAASDATIVLSKMAKHDFETAYPKYAYKAAIYSPICYRDDNIYEVNPMTITRKYNLPDKFLFLPNQFWKHKNHISVIEALRILRARNVFPTVVCAGNSSDYRNPVHFSELMTSVAKSNLHNQFIYIGLIPRDDVLSLMRQSIAVINPSLFEGFGFTVNEAHMIGKRCILSNIPPHREQDTPHADYFTPTIPDALAHCIEDAWANNWVGTDRDLEMVSRAKYEDKMHESAKSFMTIVHTAIDRSKS